MVGFYKKKYQQTTKCLNVDALFYGYIYEILKKQNNPFSGMLHKRTNLVPLFLVKIAIISTYHLLGWANVLIVGIW